jgi:hypothetical protein
MADPLYKLEISASSVAWYAAIVATISMFVSLIQLWRDRAKIRIEYSRDMKIIGTTGPYSPDTIYFNVTVINKGRRPINITKAAIRNLGSKKKFLVLNDSFSPARNRVLTEDNPTAEFFVEQGAAMLDSAFYISVHDATGRKYKKYLHRFPTFWWIWYKVKNQIKK